MTTTKKRPPRSERRCAFCGRLRSEVKKLIAGPAVYICDRCIERCDELLKDDEAYAKAGIKGPVGTTPAKICEQIGAYVVGQDHAKKILSVAVYNHLKRIRHKESRDKSVTLEKGNILLMGPTGCGKTALARALARAMDVPFAIADCTPLTQAGYVGEDIESIIVKLFYASGRDVEKTEKGVIFLDEIDKLAARSVQGRDVSGEGVQQGLLKILEGKKMEVRIGGDKATGLGAEVVKIDTTNILFICGGAFAQMAAQFARGESSAGGFLAAREVRRMRTYRDVTAEDLHKFGMLPEFVGRIPIRVGLDALTEEDLIRIMTEPKDALLKQYQKLFKLSDNELQATPKGLQSVARKALDKGTGARGLRAILEDLLLDAMYDAPNTSGQVWTINEDSVTSSKVETKVA